MDHANAMLRKSREKLGLTVRDVAEKVGVTPSAIAQYEVGHSLPSQQRAVLLAEVLGVSPSSIRVSKRAGRGHGKNFNITLRRGMNLSKREIEVVEGLRKLDSDRRRTVISIIMDSMRLASGGW